MEDFAATYNALMAEIKSQGTAWHACEAEATADDNRNALTPNSDSPDTPDHDLLNMFDPVYMEHARGAAYLAFKRAFPQYSTIVLLRYALAKHEVLKNPLRQHDDFLTRWGLT